MTESRELSRKQFLVGGAVLSAGLTASVTVSASASLAGCSGSDSSSGARSGGAGQASTKRARVTAAKPPSPTVPRDSPNPYLRGNFAPVHSELNTPNLLVRGTIPKELRGRLLRNGPNPIVAPNPAKYHWFLGDGMVHGIELGEGKASYRNRWVRTDQALKSLHEPARLGQPAEVSPAGSAANTSLVAHAGKILALYEVALPTEISTDLETLGRYDMHGALKTVMTAHPKIDPVSGEMLCFGANFLAPPYVAFHTIDRHGKLTRTVDIDIPRPVMMHDFAVTQHHVVFMDLPVVYDLNLFTDHPFPATWKPSAGARLGVLARSGSEKVRWIDIPPCYVFHVANAFERGNTIVMDVVRYSKMFDRDRYGVAEGLGSLHRWTIDLDRGSVADEILDDRGQEFPRIDPRRAGLEHRFSYAVATSESSRGEIGFGGVIKHDHQTKSTTMHQLAASQSAGEAVFVPANATAGQDEGWVLTVVYDAATDGSELLILDAADIAKAPVATVRLPQRVPFGFHGIWVPEA